MVTRRCFGVSRKQQSSPQFEQWLPLAAGGTNVSPAFAKSDGAQSDLVQPAPPATRVKCSIHKARRPIEFPGPKFPGPLAIKVLAHFEGVVTG